MKHHTKDKGDLGVLLVAADLMKHGIQVCLPVSEHLPFDLIAVSEDAKLKRIQVKYRSSLSGGVNIVFHNNYNDQHGLHTLPAQLDKIDAYAVCCPEKLTVHYIRVSEIVKATMTIRLNDPKNNQKKNIRLWDLFIDPTVMFK